MPFKKLILLLAHSVLDSTKTLKDYTKTDVWVKRMDESEIEEYISTSEPYDKAGGYAVQGLFSRFVEKIRGDYLGIVGLSASRTYDMLKEFDIK